MNSTEAAYIFNQPKPGQPGFMPSDQFPGAQFGASVEQIRQLIGRQKGAKGYTLALTIGTTEHNIQMPGDAVMMLGFMIRSYNPGETFSLKINGEICLDQVPASCYTNLNKIINDEYYILPRPLSGQDEIIFTFTATGARNQQVEFLYVKAPL